jgi:hypothetical protein
LVDNLYSIERLGLCETPVELRNLAGISFILIFLSWRSKALFGGDT